jgi:hypothetical protein
LLPGQELSCITMGGCSSSSTTETVQDEGSKTAKDQGPKIAEDVTQVRKRML